MLAGRTIALGMVRIDKARTVVIIAVRGGGAIVTLGAIRLEMSIVTFGAIRLEMSIAFWTKWS